MTRKPDLASIGSRLKDDIISVGQHIDVKALVVAGLALGMRKIGAMALVSASKP